MRTTRTPVLKDIVFVGAGHSHVGVLRMFGMNPMQREGDHGRCSATRRSA